MFNPLEEIQKPFVQRLLILVLLALLALLLVWTTLFFCPPEKDSVGLLKRSGDTLPALTPPTSFEALFPRYLTLSQRCSRYARPSGYGSVSAVVGGEVSVGDEGERTGRHP